MSRSSSELRSSSEQCMNTKRAAFQSLLQKLRYPSQRARSKLILRPGVASDAQVKRTASAPNAGMPLGNVLRVSLAIASLCFGLNKPWVRFSTSIARNPVDQINRIKCIALRLGHFLAMRIAHQSMHIDSSEGDAARKVQAHHRHPSHPEKENIETGDEYR